MMKNNNALEPGKGSSNTPLSEFKKPVIELSSDNEPLTYSLPTLYYRFAEQISKRGFSNGLLRIPEETYENYITAYEENKRIGIFISNMERKAELKDQKIKETEENRNHLQAIFIQKKQESDFQQQEKEKYSRLLDEIQNRVKEIKDHFLNSPPAYGWIGTLLFLAAGVIFIITDISIIRTIANTALDMGIKEAGTIALGFAFLAIILKPLVDRVFEKPYQKGNTKWMHGLLIGVGLCTIMALGFLGAYRTDAFIAAKKERALRDEIGVIQDRIDRGLPLLPGMDLEERKKELEEVLETYDSWLVSGIFISSSILFAIAGAICFSIGVPTFRQHTNRITERSLLFFQKENFHRKNKRADKHWRLAENDWKIAEQKLPQLPNLTILESELKRIMQEIQIARMAQHQAHTEAVLAIYQDSYQRGERYIPSEEELAQFEILLAEQNGIKQRNYQLNRQFSGSNLFNSQYLHEYIRQKIHKENKQKAPQKESVYTPNGHRN